MSIIEQFKKSDISSAVDFLAIAKNPVKNTTKLNNSYWTVEFSDKPGVSIQARIWSPLSDKIDIVAGQIYQLSATIDSYNGNMQIKVIQCKIPQNQEEIDDFKKSYEFIDPKFFDGICKYVDSIKHLGFQQIAKNFLADSEAIAKFKKYPAASAMHHNYIGGLCQHTFEVMETAIDMSKYYKVNLDLLITGALFHDIAKIVEYTEDGSVTIEGNLIGHIVYGIKLLEKYAKDVVIDSYDLMHLEHLIISHHGKLEWGSPKTPRTAEAFILSQADNINAKLSAINSIIEGVEEQGTRVRSFDNDAMFCYKR